MLALSVITLLAFALNADAHGNLKVPQATFQDGAPTVEWVTMIDNFWDIGSGGDQVGKFKTMAKEKGMSVKDVTWTLSRSSDGKVKWWGNGGGGFTHTGPCELYIDDKMVLHGDDCEEEFPGGPNGSNKMSEMPVDFSSCNGKCTLTIYWLGFLKRAVASGSTPGSAAEVKTPAVPSTSTDGSTNQEQAPEAPSPETQSKEGSSNKEKTPEAPTSETTPAPAAEKPSEEPPTTNTQTTEAPSSETQDTKCNAPARRLRKKFSTV
ncbi:hypothetical protein GN244_ATG01963 [Phytophthora infestans]|uniref:Uncharacterized protein n=1 Tax=Phytophthora infestans TaxID=4787 RepID=A0A833T933_PHYIN|nr:hypothetical protein GN244_ATG01963 [Phytophthora infestans]